MWGICIRPLSERPAGLAHKPICPFKMTLPGTGGGVWCSILRPPLEALYLFLKSSCVGGWGEGGLVEMEYGIAPPSGPWVREFLVTLFRRKSEQSVSRAFVSSLPLTCLFPDHWCPWYHRSPVFYLWPVSQIQNSQVSQGFARCGPLPLSQRKAS